MYMRVAALLVVASVVRSLPADVSVIGFTTGPTSGYGVVVNGWSTASAAGAIETHPMSTVDKIVSVFPVATSTDENGSTSIEEATIAIIPVAASNTAEVSTFPFTVTADGTEEVRTATVTLFPAPASAASSTGLTSTDMDTSSGDSRKGAIAGGVIGAIVVAAILAILYARYRGKRSTRHWRNRISQGQWHNLDRKTSYSASVSVGAPVHRNPVTPFADSPSTPRFDAPLAPLFIREKHRPTVEDPFAVDPHSPGGGNPRAHKRGQSSFGSFGGGRHGETHSIEMDAPIISEHSKR